MSLRTGCKHTIFSPPMGLQGQSLHYHAELIQVHERLLGVKSNSIAYLRPVVATDLVYKSVPFSLPSSLITFDIGANTHDSESTACAFAGLLLDRHYSLINRCFLSPPTSAHVISCHGLQSHEEAVDVHQIVRQRRGIPD